MTYGPRPYQTLHALHRGDVVLLEGCRFKATEDHEKSWVVPRENAYLFDTWECVRVEEVQ